MESNWVPASAAALVTGGLALFLATLLVPAAEDSGGSLIQLVHDERGRWLAVALLLFACAVCLLLGLPCIVGLLLQRTKVLGFAGLMLLVVACAATAGYAVLLIFFRSLVLADGLRPTALGEAVGDPVMTTFLVGWLLAFGLGEALVAVALLRGHTTRRWVPAALLLHVATIPLESVLPDPVQSVTALALVVGLAGIATEANNVRDLVRFRTMTRSH